jgi:hypothetical protein
LEDGASFADIETKRQALKLAKKAIAIYEDL